MSLRDYSIEIVGLLVIGVMVVGLIKVVTSPEYKARIVADTKLEELYTEDGVRCIFYKRGYGGGLSCDWRK